jgi:hypothetical protein
MNPVRTPHPVSFHFNIILPATRRPPGYVVSSSHLTQFLYAFSSQRRTTCRAHSRISTDSCSVITQISQAGAQEDRDLFRTRLPLWCSVIVTCPTHSPRNHYRDCDNASTYGSGIRSDDFSNDSPIVLMAVTKYMPVTWK